MGNLEKLYWIDAFAVTGYGVRVGVRVNDAALIERLRSRLPPGAKISPMGTVDRMLSVIQAPPSERRGVKNYHLLYADHMVVGRSHRLDAVLDNYDTHLRMAMAELSRRKLFVHAGVVAWKDRAILLPGRTLAGKTHLVAELVKAGATYLSDEYAVLDEDGFVHPFAKPLSMRPSTTAPQVETPVEEIGGVPGRTPVPVGLVVMSQFEGARWRPKRLTTGQGVLELLDNTFSAPQSPEHAIRILGRVASGATVLKGKRGDAGTMSEPRFGRGRGRLSSQRRGIGDDDEPMPKAKTERLIVTQIDGETLVYDRGRDAASCLNEFAAKVWRECDGETSVAAIAAALGEDERAVWLALHQLTKSQLLTEAIAFPPEMNTAKSRREIGGRLGSGRLRSSPASSCRWRRSASCGGDGARLHDSHSAGSFVPLASCASGAYGFRDSWSETPGIWSCGWLRSPYAGCGPRLYKFVGALP